MRILKFLIDKQIICQDPSCDFSGLVPGTEGYLKAEFIFSQEWDGCEKIAVFKSNNNEFPVRLKRGSCEIPPKALAYKKFKIRVIGLKPGYRIQTNDEEVKQNG